MLIFKSLVSKIYKLPQKKNSFLFFNLNQKSVLYTHTCFLFFFKKKNNKLQITIVLVQYYSLLGFIFYTFYQLEMITYNFVEQIQI